MLIVEKVSNLKFVKNLSIPNYYKNYYYYHKVVSQEDIDNYFFHYIEKFNQGHIYLATQKSVTSGFGIWKVSPSESNFLKMRTANIVIILGFGIPAEEEIIKERIIVKMLEDCEQDGAEYITFKIPTEDIITIHLLESFEFNLIETITTYSFDLKKDIPLYFDSEDNILIRPFRKDDLNIITKIASISFKHDRFHRDPLISKKTADNIYRSVIESLCTKKTESPLILVAENEKEIVGFIICSIDPDSLLYLGKKIGKVSFIAVSEKFRNHLIGTNITIASLKFLQNEGVNFVEIEIPLINIYAIRMCEAIGFNLVNSFYIFRKYLI